MKLDIECNRLLGPLGRVSGVVERRQTLPILANVRVSLADGTLTLVGTDLEVEIRETIDGVAGESGETTITARKMLDICRALPDQAALQLNTINGRVQLKSGKSRFTLQTLPAAEYPSIETEQWEERFVVAQKALRTLIEKTAFSMAHQDVRYYLNGLLLELEGDTLRAVATDGHRLAKSALKLDTAVAETRQIIVPRKAILELVRLLSEDGEPVTVEINPKHMRVRVGNTVCITKLIDGKFPEYQAVISPLLTHTLTVDRQQLLDSLTRAAILTNDKYRGVRLSIDRERVSITAHTPDQEEASDEFPISFEGEPLEIGFNVTYVIEALRAIEAPEVEIRLRDTNSSCTINAPDDETLYLIMPMRL